MENLKRIHLITEVTQELGNSIGLPDKTIAEFVIELMAHQSSPNQMHEELVKQGIELPLGFVETLYKIVRRLNSQENSPSHNNTSNKITNIKLPSLDNAKKRKSHSPRSDPSSAIHEFKYNKKNITEPKKAFCLNQLPISRIEKDINHYRQIDGIKKNNSNYIATPELHKCYRGRVSKVMEYGCIVELTEFKEKHEGHVHISNFVFGTSHAKVIPKPGVKVWVKIISQTGSKLVMSMRDVNQNTGEDLTSIDDKCHSSSHFTTGLKGLSGIKETSFDHKTSRDSNNFIRLTSPERFEIQQLIASNVLSADELECFGYNNSENTMLKPNNELEEEFEVDLNDDEADFLKGRTERSASQTSPPRVVRAPEGSLNRAAMTASALSKERRELKDDQQRALVDAIPTDLSKPWEDPMAETSDRHLAAELRGMNLLPPEIPEWKNAAFGKSTSFGKIDSRSIKEQRGSLPIFAQKDNFISAVKLHQVIVAIGETGSGKTTQMPQYLANSGFCKKGLIACTQPRRVAAQSIAKRVADEVGCRIGDEVGYNVRFDDCTGPNTIIKYMTDGMLLREALIDTNLSRYSVIILDEAHERTINTDVLFGVLKNVVQHRSDLKLIVTSATLDAEKFSTYFFNSPIFTIKGRMYPVEKFYSKQSENDYLDAALTTIMQIHLTEPEGDILVFLTGMEEIETACQILHDRMHALGQRVPRLFALPVYSALPSEVQSQIFEPAKPGTRKCVIATNIAEASITIDGIFYVIDPGMCKMNVFNPKTGLESLIVIPISQASANQRAGRAGRTGPGKCFRLYTEEAFKYEMYETSVPEIQRCNLGMILLTLKAMGVNDLLEFDFMDPPPEANLVYALEILYNLGALDNDGLLTELGRKMAEFPLDPPMSKVLLASVDLGCSDEIITIMSMLQVQNVFYRPRDKQAQADQMRAKQFQHEGDHLTLLSVYNSWKDANLTNTWCNENFIQIRGLKTAQDTRKQLISIMDRYNLNLVSSGRNYRRIQKAVTSGYFFHVARKDPQEGYKSVVEQHPLYMHPSSSLFQQQPDWVIYHTSTVTTKEYMREVMVIDPKWLVELAPRFFRPSDKYKLSRRKRYERLDPLYDRYHDPKSWRLSKRRG
jgi:ATP-dependent RNA helicase DHX8/PRP22